MTKYIILLFFIVICASGDIEEAQKYEVQAQIAQKNGNHDFACYNYSRAADAYKELGNIEKSRELHSKEAEECEMDAQNDQFRGDHFGAAVSYGYAARAHEDLGNVDKSKALYTKAAGEFEQEFAKARNIAGNELMTGWFAVKAAESREKSDDIGAAKVLFFVAAIEYERIARRFMIEGPNPTAGDYYNEAAEAYKSSGNNEQARVMYNNAWRNYISSRKDSKASEMLSKLEKLPQTEL